MQATANLVFIKSNSKQITLKLKNNKSMMFNKLRTFATMALLFGVGMASAQTEQAKLDAARALWGSYFFSNYQYTFSAACNTCYIGNYPWRVQVSGGVAPKAVNSKGLAATGALSVAQIFETIQAAISNPADSAFAIYDPIFGYPTRYQLQYGNQITDKFEYAISGFIQEAGSPTEQYTQNRQVWASQRVYNYNFKYTEVGPNPNNIQWPLTVKVRNGSPAETLDNNGNRVTYLIPQTFDQYFDMIKRQLDANAPFVDNEYSKRGYMTDMFMVTNTAGTINIKIADFSDTNL